MEMWPKRASLTNPALQIRNVANKFIGVICVTSIAALLSCGGGDSKELKNSPPQVPDTAEISPLAFESSGIILGEMVPEVSQTVSVRVKNVSSTPQRIETVVSDCGCATPTWVDEPIAPGSTADIELTVDPGSKQGIKLSKKVTVVVENGPPISLGIEGHVRTFVTYSPDSIDAPPDDASDVAKVEIVLESADGALFKINTVLPAVQVVQTTSPALRQVVVIDWEKWRTSGQPNKIEILTTHPQAPALSVTVRRSKEKR